MSGAPKETSAALKRPFFAGALRRGVTSPAYLKTIQTLPGKFIVLQSIYGHRKLDNEAMQRVLLESRNRPKRFSPQL